MKILKPPAMFDQAKNCVFLAGSIEMDTASNWQEKVQEALIDKDVTIYNPRRDSWDSSWKQDCTDINFVTQVSWELSAMDWVSTIVMYFDPETKSPVTLLELGLYAASKKLIVCCPEGFWRKGNVDMVCRKYNVRMVETLEDLIEALRAKL